MKTLNLIRNLDDQKKQAFLNLIEELTDDFYLEKTGNKETAYIVWDNREWFFLGSAKPLEKYISIELNPYAMSFFIHSCQMGTLKNILKVS